METSINPTDKKDAPVSGKINDFFQCSLKDQQIIHYMLRGNRDGYDSSRAYLDKKANFDSYYNRVTRFS